MADVLIVGAGIVGSAIALELADRGARVRLLERAVPGAESSSAAAGMLAPQLEAHGPDAAFRLGLASRRLYAGWVARVEGLSGEEVAYRVDGAVQAFEDEVELEDAWRRARWQLDLGLAVERLDADAVRAARSGLAPAVRGGLLFPDEGQVDPRRLMRALAGAVRAAGVEVESGRTARRIRIEAGRATGVELEDGVIAADRVIVAAGAWSPLVEGCGLPADAVQPARGQMLALDPGSVLGGPYLWAAGGYIVPRRDGRVLVGATVERVGFDKAVTVAGLARLLDIARRAMPALAEARVVETWSGLRPWTASGARILGATAVEGLLVATGHHRNGILQAPATAHAIAELALGGAPSPDLAPFAPARFA